LPLIKEAGKGANICITSSVTGKNPQWTFGVYSSTKAALDNMVNWMATELMSDGIRVTGIAPGLIKTELSAPLWKGAIPAPEESKGMPDQIGSVVATICSKDGSFMNGEVY
jgi:NAD(P)-dependent dehydrogenase (short-subunit alcohol dehydrogenase family)